MRTITTGGICLWIAACAVGCTDSGAGSPDAVAPAADLRPDQADAGPDQRAVPDLRQSPDRRVTATFAPANLPLSSLACVAGQLSTGSSSGAVAARADDLARLTDVGVGLLRSDFLWHRIEKVKGTFSFAEYDARVAAASAAGVAHLGLLAYGNPWATSLTTSDYHYPPDDPADFGRYVKATVSHYKGKLDTYEVWNEPNAGWRFWKSNPKGDPKVYGALLKAAYTAAKQADPKATVLFGGPFFHEQMIPGHLGFLADVYKHHPDLGRYYDGMALHPYALYPPGIAPEKIDAWEIPVDVMLGRVRDLMAKHGDGSKPIYVTEAGWPVWKKVSEKQQGEYLVRSFLMLAAAGARAYCWYTLRDFDSHAVSTEATFGLLAHSADRTKARLKPAYTAYKTLLKTVGQYKIIKRLHSDLSMPAGVFAYGLQHITTGARATALWTTSATGVTVDLPLAPSTASVTTVTTTGQTAKPSFSAGKLRVAATTGPIYILER